MNDIDFCSLPEEVRQQLSIVDQSQQNLAMIIAATLISYYNIDIQRQQLICAATDPSLCDCLPDTMPLQAISGIMVIVPLLYFFNLSEQTLEQTPDDPELCQRNQLSHLASTLVLLAAIIRFGLTVEGETELQMDT